MKEYAGRVPLILKLNGKTNIADDGDAVSPLTASVEDAVRLGADAVGYTLYVGSPRQDAEIREFQKVRQDCERLGMPLVMWAYPRGRAIDAKGGKGTLYAQDYAARVAEELGADLVKLHEPEEDNERSPGAVSLAARRRRRSACAAWCARPAACWSSSPAASSRTTTRRAAQGRLVHGRRAPPASCSGATCGCARSTRPSPSPARSTGSWQALPIGTGQRARDRGKGQRAKAVEHGGARSAAPCEGGFGGVANTHRDHA